MPILHSIKTFRGIQIKPLTLTFTRSQVGICILTIGWSYLGGYGTTTESTRNLFSIHYNIDRALRGKTTFFMVSVFFRYWKFGERVVKPKMRKCWRCERDVEDSYYLSHNDLCNECFTRYETDQINVS